MIGTVFDVEFPGDDPSRNDVAAVNIRTVEIDLIPAQTAQLGYAQPMPNSRSRSLPRRADHTDYVAAPR
jgi:hypothetical protein